MPDGRSFARTTLLTAETQPRKLLGDDIDLRVSLHGLEDVCTDAVGLTEQSEAAFVRAPRSPPAPSRTRPLPRRHRLHPRARCRH